MGDATESIMVTVKKMLGIAQEYNAFNVDIMVDINSVFLTLNQLGVGPERPFQITGTDETWDEFLGDQSEILVGVQTYVYLKTRLLFDPPTNSFLVTSMEEQCKELEWRMNQQVERSWSGSSNENVPEEDEAPDLTEPEARALRDRSSKELATAWREMRRRVHS